DRLGLDLHAVDEDLRKARGGRTRRPAAGAFRLGRGRSRGHRRPRSGTGGSGQDEAGGVGHWALSASLRVTAGPPKVGAVPAGPAVGVVDGRRTAPRERTSW